MLFYDKIYLLTLKKAVEMTKKEKKIISMGLIAEAFACLYAPDKSYGGFDWIWDLYRVNFEKLIVEIIAIAILTAAAYLLIKGGGND